MSAGVRKVALTIHVTSSVGWLGSVAAFLALALAGLRSQEPETIRAAYLAMEMTAWMVIVPLAFVSLISGLVQSLGTHWGLLRNYWVVTKLVLTVIATVVLLLKMAPIGYLADAVRYAPLPRNESQQLRIELVAHAAGGLFVLLVATTLSVFKPWGLTQHGRQEQVRERTAL